MKNIETIKLNSMKLLHYFITKEHYRPILIHGVENEVWLENFQHPFRIVRIVSKKISSRDDLTEDLDHVHRMAKKIKVKTMSLSMRILNIYLDSSMIIPNEKKIVSIDLVEEDLRENKQLVSYFKDLATMEYEEDSLQFAIRASTEINLRNAENAKQAKEVFEEKKPFITYLLIAINIIVFALMEYKGGSTLKVNLIEFGAQYNPLIKSGEYFRLFTPMFIHIGYMHLIVNMYSLYILGKSVETFYGWKKYLTIYLISGIISNLFSFVMVDGISGGASGAIFGIFGAFAYFAYHHRIILGPTLKNDLLPILLINLFFGFMVPGINNAAHIGGLLGGVLVAAAVGVRYKSHWQDQLIALLLIVILATGLSYIGFFKKVIYRYPEIDNVMIQHYLDTNQTDRLKDYVKKIEKFDVR